MLQREKYIRSDSRLHVSLHRVSMVGHLNNGYYSTCVFTYAHTSNDYHFVVHLQLGTFANKWLSNTLWMTLHPSVIKSSPPRH